MNLLKKLENFILSKVPEKWRKSNLFFLALLATALPVTLYLVSQQIEVRQRASGLPATPPTTFAFGKAISVNDTGLEEFIPIDGKSLITDNQTFTVEMWAKWTTNTSSQQLIHRTQSTVASPSSFEISLWTNPFNLINKRLVGIIGTETTQVVAESDRNYLDDMQWHHLALVNVSGELRLYVDGRMVSSQKNDLPVKYGQGKLFIARDPLMSTGDDGFRGLIDEIRISSTERYKTNFSPQYSPFSKDTETLALWHFDGNLIDDVSGASNLIGQATFVDSSILAPTPTIITPTSAPTPPIPGDAYLLFGKTARFDGKTSYITIPSGKNTPEIASDYTIEAWIKPDPIISDAAEIIATKDNGSGATADYMFYREDGTGALLGRHKDTVTHGNLKISSADEKWYHVAFVKTSGSIKIFKDGILDKEQPMEATNNTDDQDLPIRIGGQIYSGTPGLMFSGEMDEFRISNVARYSSNFIPQRLPFKPDAGTKVLWHFDGDVKDAGSNGKDGIISGDIQFVPSTFAKAKNFGKAAEFPKGNNYIKYDINSSGLDPKGPMTLETWISIEPTISTKSIWPIYKTAQYQYPNGPVMSTLYYLQYYNGKLTIDLNNSASNKKGFATVPFTADGKWHHVAGINDGSKIVMFIDGVIVGQNPLSDSYPVIDNSTPLYLGNYPTSSPLETTVRIDEVRVSNSVRYSQRFKPAAWQFEGDKNTIGLWHLNENILDASENPTYGATTGFATFITSGVPFNDPYSEPIPTPLTSPTSTPTLTVLSPTTIPTKTIYPGPTRINTPTPILPTWQATPTSTKPRAYKCDFNKDRVLDLQDYNIWLRQFTNPKSRKYEKYSADCDKNGIVDIFDYNSWASELKGLR